MDLVDNPFAPVTQDERVVLNHLRSLLNRLSPEIQQAVLSDLASIDIPPLNYWTSERETGDPVPESVHLIGLSKYPPVDGALELHSKPGGGPVDLYSETDDVAVAIEGKTKSSLRQEQLSRYATELSADSHTMVSWSSLYRSLSEYTSNMNPYPAGLTEDFLDYLKYIGLHKPHRAAKYVWGDGDGKKLIRVEESGDDLNVIWKAKATQGQGKHDKRVLSWEEFCELFDDIERKHGRDLVRRLFVNLNPPAQQPELNGNTVIGEIDPIREGVSDEHFLRLNYHGGDDGDIAIKLRTVRHSEGGTVGAPYNPGTDCWVWYTKDNELPKLLDPQDHLPGFESEFRETLFLERDYDQVRSRLW
jgi:hypothetical protein